MSRWFEVQQDETVYRTVTWRVEADSHEEAEQKIYDGEGDWCDSDDYDSDYGEVTNVECRDCGETCAENCKCERVDHEFMAEIGL